MVCTQQRVHLQAEMKARGGASDDFGPYTRSGDVARLKRRATYGQAPDVLNLAYSLWGKSQMPAVQVCNR